MKNLTQKRLKEVLHYDPDTGVFTRLISIGNAKPGDIANAVNGEGYIKISIDGKRYAGHRLAWLYVTGEWPDKIDHEKGNRKDNRFKKLQSVSVCKNSKNRKIPKTNTSGLIGVYWHKNIKKWYAAIGVEGKLKTLGYFIDKFEAICIRKSAERKYGFHENHGGR